MITAQQIKNIMGSLEENPIDFTRDPVLPFNNGKGTNGIKIAIIGQDPTIRNAARRNNIACTLNLDKEGPLKDYVTQIAQGLGCTLDEVYATNLFKYFYTKPPSETMSVLQIHLQPNLDLLKDELSNFPNAKILTLGEPVLKLLTDNNHYLRDYWNYNNCGFHCVPADDNTNKLGKLFYPFCHQPSYSRKAFYKNNFSDYINEINQGLKN